MKNGRVEDRDVARDRGGGRGRGGGHYMTLLKWAGMAGDDREGVRLIA